MADRVVLRPLQPSEVPVVARWERDPDNATFVIPWSEERHVAAAALRTIGLSNATDVVGGLQAWRAAGLPLAAPGAVTPPRPAPGQAYLSR